MTFAETLEYGRAGESRIARWLRSRGCSVLPVYEKEIDDKQGPRLFLPNGTLIAPDLLVWNGDGAWWMEAKRKTAFSWYRSGECWCTGIDIRHYNDYLRINRESPWSVWLLFLHEGGHAKDSPEESPAGLFGETLTTLQGCEHHRSDRWGSSGMVYWEHCSLKLLARLEDL